MHLKKLIIHNIASIEDATIDFDAEPLLSSEVFLITGKTGAGKSTILDSICLALYSNTPRLDNTNMQGEVKDGEKDIKINNPCQLMRRNTAEAWTKLIFRGSNGVNYEAEWSVKRAHKRVSGSLQSKQWFLRNLDTNITIDKDNQIKDELQRAIGLDFNQFCRTTMLAQGEFTRFLNSADNEKAAILEKITKVSVYSKIGKKIFDITKDKRTEWETAQNRVKETQVLSDEDVVQKNEELKVLENKYNTTKTLSDVATKKINWLENENKFRTDIERAKNELKNAQDNVATEDFKQKTMLIADWESTTEVRQWLLNIDKNNEECQRQKAKLQLQSNRYAELCGQHQRAIGETNNIRNQINDIEKFLFQEKDKVETYDNAQTIIGLLKNIINANKLIEQKNVEKVIGEKLLQEKLLPVVAQTNKEIEEVQDELKNQEAIQKQYEDALDKFGLSSMRQKLDSANRLINNIKIAQQHIEQYVKETDRFTMVEKNMLQLHNAISVKQKQLETIISQFHDAEIKKNACKESLETQRNSVNKFAISMRAKLNIGDVCPVCQQKIENEIPHEDELAKLFSGIEELYKKADDNYNKLNNEKNRLEAELKADTNSLLTIKQQVNESGVSVKKAHNLAIELCNTCGITWSDENTTIHLEEEKNKVTAEITSLNEQIKKGEELTDTIAKIHKKIDIIRKKIDELKHIAQKNNETVLNCQNTIKTADELINSKKTEIESSDAEVRTLVANVGWNIDYRRQPSEFVQMLSKAANTYKSKNEEQQRLKIEHKQKADNCNDVAEVINNILILMPQWSNVLPTCRQNYSTSILPVANDIYTQTTTANSIIQKADADTQINREKIASFVANNNISFERIAELNSVKSENIEALKNEIEKKKYDVISKQSALSTIEEQCKIHKAERPQISENETLESIICNKQEVDKQLSSVNQEIGAINQLLATDRENRKRLGTLVAEVETKKQEYDKWHRLDALLGDSEGKKFRRIAQSYVLTSLIHAANIYMRQLTDRYTLRIAPGNLVIMIEDAYQGYTSRAASTISGGESFLVSLSLALALSDIGEQLAVDTLFIDEGFGTLSGEPLQKSIATLRSLHSKSGRRVGIISHVEELRERIPVQIQVNQEGNHSSSMVSVVSI